MDARALYGLLCRPAGARGAGTCGAKRCLTPPHHRSCAAKKPNELFGKFTWKIENFSEISKRELRSNQFDVGDYKW